MNVKEECLYCKKETEVDVDTHIDYRDYYVEGAGQLCRDCWEEIYSD